MKARAPHLSRLGTMTCFRCNALVLASWFPEPWTWTAEEVLCDDCVLVPAAQRAARQEW